MAKGKKTAGRRKGSLNQAGAPMYLGLYLALERDEMLRETAKVIGELESALAALVTMVVAKQAEIVNLDRTAATAILERF